MEAKNIVLIQGFGTATVQGAVAIATSKIAQASKLANHLIDVTHDEFLINLEELFSALDVAQECLKSINSSLSPDSSAATPSGSGAPSSPDIEKKYEGVVNSLIRYVKLLEKHSTLNGPTDKLLSLFKLRGDIHRDVKANFQTVGSEGDEPLQETRGGSPNAGAQALLRKAQ